MAPAAPENLFPLPLTAFENFMLADESSEYPMVFFMQVRLRGVIDAEVMRLAVDNALSRHPLLCCRVEKYRGKMCWVWNGDEIPETNWDPEDWIPQAPWNTAIDLRKHNGLRVWGEQLEDQATITLQFHHACCDGIGAARFLEDIAISYSLHDVSTGTAEDACQPVLRPVCLESLKTRGRQEGRRVAQVRGSVFRRIRILLKYTLRYLRQQKLPLVSKAPATASERQDGLGLYITRLDRRRTRALRELAKSHNSSLNDVLVKELMMMARRFNSRDSGVPQPRFLWKQPTICVLVPTSLRGPTDLELPSCNVVSYVFMARPWSLTDAPDQLLQSIRDEMQLVHQSQAGWLFVQAIEGMQKVPGLMKLVMRRTRDSCMSTTVLSHMGNLFNTVGSRLRQEDGKPCMGQLQIEEIVGIPPIRKGTTAAFSTMLVDGCLSISMRCCPRKFSKSEADELLATFVSCLEGASGAPAEDRSIEERSRQDSGEE